MAIDGISSTTKTSTTTTGLTADQAKAVVKSVTDQTSASLEKQKGSLSYLGEGRIGKIETKTSDEMKQWLAAHPNATEAEIKKEASRLSSKNTSVQIFDKMATDNFFKNLMNRRKELMSEMWG
jgi:hypothetical protein